MKNIFVPFHLLCTNNIYIFNFLIILNKFFPFIHNKEPFSAFVIWSKAANIYVILLNIPILTKHLTKCIGIVFVYALK